MSTEKAVNENFAGNPNFSNNFFFWGGDQLSCKKIHELHVRTQLCVNWCISKNSLQPVFKTNAFSNKGGEHKENINGLL